MIKRSSLYIFIFCSLFLNFIAGLILCWFVRYLYWFNTHRKGVDYEATMIADAIDRIGTIPWVMHVSIGMAIGMIFMIAWSIWDNELFKRR